MIATESLKVSIADDEPRMRDYLWKSLERMGHVVVSGAERQGIGGAMRGA